LHGFNQYCPAHFLTLQSAFSSTQSRPNTVPFVSKRKNNNKKRCIYLYVITTALEGTWSWIGAASVLNFINKSVPILQFLELKMLRFKKKKKKKKNLENQFLKGGLFPDDTKKICLLMSYLKNPNPGRQVQGRKKPMPHSPGPFLVVPVQPRHTQEHSSTAKSALHAGHSLACFLLHTAAEASRTSRKELALPGLPRTSSRSSSACGSGGFTLAHPMAMHLEAKV
jgi:hypothetical protein